VSEQKETPQEIEALANSSDEQSSELDHHSDAEEPHEDHHSSLSSRVLKVLFILAIGCGIGLWGAPKLAPMLPQGLAPVAEFLMPGQFEAKSDVAALRVETSEKLALLETRPVGDVSKADLENALAALAAQNDAKFTALSDQINAQDIETRLSKTESQIESITAELAAMNERLAMQITENGAALSDEAASKLSGYQAVVNGLKAQIDALADKNGALSQRIEDIANTSTLRMQEARDSATEKVANTAASRLLADINTALDKGTAFNGALDALTDLTGITAPQGLRDMAQGGVPSLSVLRNQFGDVAYNALRADTQAQSGEGVVGKLGAFLRTQVGTRSLSRQDGTSTDAILSRIEDELAKGNLTQALTEAGTLADAPKTAMQDWLASLLQLSTARAALADLSQSLSATQ
jgi:hypothetical protein